MKDTITLNTVATYDSPRHAIQSARNIVRWNPPLALMIMLGVSGRNLSRLETVSWNNSARYINNFLDSLATMTVTGDEKQRKLGKLKEQDIWWGDKDYYKSPYDFSPDSFKHPIRLSVLEESLI